MKSTSTTTPNAFHTRVIAEHAHSNARVTEVSTPHGQFLTPAFMPVGTRAAVNCMAPDQLQACGTDIMLGGNTYHMLVAPGMEIIEAAGGMHSFMDWQGPMLTDSGGFQVFSLSKNAKICRINEDGAHFKHPISGKVIDLTPESSIATQKIIGADIIMAFDECTPEHGGRAAAIAAMERTHRWLRTSKAAHDRNPNSAYGQRQALFAIIQGGRYRDLREQSTAFILEQHCDGIAIGGESIGFDMEITADILDWVRPLLPPEKSRYTMGVGLRPQDLIDVVHGGIDLFDCVAPTRNARHGALYHGHTRIDGNWVRFYPGEEGGRILIKKRIYATDDTPILDGCDCYTCQHFCRAYLHYLFKEKQALYQTLACIHNVRVMHRSCETMRELILQQAR